MYEINNKTVSEINEIAKRETIDLSKTFVNMLYGSKIKPSNYKRIKAKFDFKKLGVIIVHKNKPNDETYIDMKTRLGISHDPSYKMYEIIDGNHRKTVLQDLFGEGTKWECIVLENLSYKERAEYFEAYNKDRRNLSYVDKFRARLEYQEAEATAIKRIANDNHLLLSDIDVGRPHTMRFGICMAISSLEKNYRTGTLAVSLDILYNAYSNAPASYSAHAYGSYSLRHLDSFIRTYENEYDKLRLITVIKKLDSYFLNSESNVNQDKSIKAKIVPMKLVELYNNKLGQDKRLDMSKLLVAFNPVIGRERIKG